MFGFSIQKLLVLAAIIGAVWYGFKFLSRLDQARKTDATGGKDSRGLAGAFRDWTRRGGSGGERPYSTVVDRRYGLKEAVEDKT